MLLTYALISLYTLNETFNNIIIFQGVIIVATKSILKTVEIKDKNMGRMFADALQASEAYIHKDVQFSKEIVELKGSSIMEFFKKDK